MYARLISELYAVCSHAVAGAVQLHARQGDRRARWLMGTCVRCLRANDFANKHGSLVRLPGELVWVKRRPRQPLARVATVL